MPLSSTSGYNPGSSYTNTAGADYGPAAMAAALLSREGQYLTQRAAAPVAAARPSVGFGGGGPAPAPVYQPQQQNRGEQESLPDRNFRSQVQRDQILQMQARQNPAPTRLVSGPQIIPGTVMDPNAMNAYQRQAYLPNAASFTPTSYTASQALSADRGEWDPYAGRRLEGPGVAMGPGADFARAQMAASARRS